MLGGDEEGMMWLDEEPETASSAAIEAGNISGRVAQLDTELARTRAELSDVRRDLAAKTVQLMRREQVAVHEKAQEIATTVIDKKDGQLQLVTAQVSQLELALAQKEEELEESRRLYNSQKRALKEAVNAAAEQEAREYAANEGNRTAVAQAVEDEMDQLQHQLALTKARSGLELKSRETEIGAMMQQLAVATTHRKQAVAETVADLTQAWQAELDRVQTLAAERAAGLEAQVVRLMTQMEDARREDAQSSLTAEVKELNMQKVQAQRELEAFKDMAMESSRANREEVVRLLDENARLHSRLASKTLDTLAGGGGSCVAPSTRVFEKPATAGFGLEGYLPNLLARLERQRKGLVPVLIVTSLLLLILTAAVVRAALSARIQHRGPLCFLSNLGISFGVGCADPTAVDLGHKKMSDLMDKTERVHDVEDLAEDGSEGLKLPSLSRRMMRGGGRFYHVLWKPLDGGGSARLSAT